MLSKQEMKIRNDILFYKRILDDGARRADFILSKLERYPAVRREIPDSVMRIIVDAKMRKLEFINVGKTLKAITDFWGLDEL